MHEGITMQQVRPVKNVSEWNQMHSPGRQAFVWQISYWKWFEEGYVLSPLLFNLPLQKVIRRVQLNQDSLKLNGTHQL